MGKKPRPCFYRHGGLSILNCFQFYDRKEFGDDLYFDHWRTKLSVPLWLSGIDLNVSYDRNDPAGKYINPEERTPPSGLTGIGLSMPLGQAMFIDARRNDVRQARLALNLAEADRIKQINKVLYDAAKTYWEWFLAYQQRQLLTEGYDLASRRFLALRERALLGDAAIIDTTEALITVQDRLVQRQQADIEELNARLRVSTVFVECRWASPLSYRPPPGRRTLLTSPDSIILQQLLKLAAERHPELLKLGVKTEQLLLEERFRTAMIQPQVSLSASLLSQTPRIDIRMTGVVIIPSGRRTIRWVLISFSPFSAERTGETAGGTGQKPAGRFWSSNKPDG